MGKTKIEWATDVWNPLTGCTKVSAGCQNCYAERVTERFGGDFSKIVLHPERLEQPLHWKKPRRIFVNSMSDLFHEKVPDEFIDKVFAVMALSSQHTFEVLTKRPERMREWFQPIGQTSRRDWVVVAACRMLQRTSPPHEILWPLPNVWVGCSVENQATADQRIPLLLQTPAAVRFLSCEPLLGPVDLTKWLGTKFYPTRPGAMDNPDIVEDGFLSRIGWVIAGGESGPKARPAHPDWFRSLRDQCQAAGTPFFFKQWGEWIPFGYVSDFCAHRRLVGKDGRSESVFSGWGNDTDAIGWREVVRVGKKAAGRLLDGREWSEFPR